MQDIDYSTLPEHCQAGMRLWIERGIMPGSFLEAVIRDEFMNAFSRADHINKTRLHDYAKFIRWKAPVGCRGNAQTIKTWAKVGGLQGLEAKRLEKENEAVR